MGGSKKKQQRNKQKAKQSKPKQSSTPRGENKGRFRYVSLQDELNARGLRIVTVAADGNCFFRAVSDQLTGSEKDHGKMREQVVRHMEKHKDEFAPFVEDDEGFDKYMKRMSKNSTWAGHMEVQATSMCFDKNIHIYQQGQPTWRVVNFQPADSGPCLHLSFHDGEHYNSVRYQSDDGGGPAEPIQLVDSSSEGTADEGAVFGEKEVRQVAENTCCFDMDSIKEALALCGSVDDATEMMIKHTVHRPPVDTDANGAALDGEQACSQPAGGAQTEDAACSASHVTVKFKTIKQKECKKIRVTLGVEVREPRASSETSIGTGGQPDAAVADAAVADAAVADAAPCSETPPIESSTENPPPQGSVEAGEAAAVVSPTVVAPQAEQADALPAKTPVKGKGVPHVGKNKQCPCGSGKKFKKCCVHVADDTQPKVQVAQSPSSGKRVTAPTTPKRFGSIDI